MEFCRHRGHICPAVMNNIVKPVNRLMFYTKNLHIKPFEHIHVRDYRYSKPCCHKSGYDLILLRFACYLRSFANCPPMEKPLLCDKLHFDMYRNRTIHNQSHQAPRQP